MKILNTKIANLWHSAGSVNGPWGNSGYYKNTNENTENIKIQNTQYENTKYKNTKIANLWHSAGSVNGPRGKSGYYSNPC